MTQVCDPLVHATNTCSQTQRLWSRH